MDLKGRVLVAKDGNQFINVAKSSVEDLYPKYSSQKAYAKFCPSAQSTQKKQILGRYRGLTLPSLQHVRAEFEKYIGDTVL